MKRKEVTEALTDRWHRFQNAHNLPTLEDAVKVAVSHFDKELCSDCKHDGGDYDKACDDCAKTIDGHKTHFEKNEEDKNGKTIRI